MDFGCGTGTLSLMVKKQFPLVAITGLDVDDDVLSIAEAKAEQGHLDIYLTKYDGEHIPFRDHQQFDMIISSLAFHHIPTATKGPLLKQLYDITKPGGKIVIADFGKPRTIYTKIAFGFFRRLDGKENTQTNRDGLLPEFVKVSRFSEVHITSSFNTAFGTIDIIKGRKVV